MSKPGLVGVLSEYFVVTNSFAAPFFSDTDERFVEAASPEDALAKVCADYSHPCGLYAAAIYTDANARAKHHAPLARYLSEKAKDDARI